MLCFSFGVWPQYLLGGLTQVSVVGRVISERLNNQNLLALRETSKTAPISPVN